MSQNGNCSMHMQCCVKSSHKEPILVQYNTIWLFMSGVVKEENWSHILETSLQDPLPTCVSVFINAYLLSQFLAHEGYKYASRIACVEHKFCTGNCASSFLCLWDIKNDLKITKRKKGKIKFFLPVVRMILMVPQYI